MYLFNNYLLNIFLTNRGPFPEFLFNIGKLNSPICTCGEIGNAPHYVFECNLTADYHFSKPTQGGEAVWFEFILKYNSNLTKLCNLMNWILANESFLHNY